MSSKWKIPKPVPSQPTPPGNLTYGFTWSKPEPCPLLNSRAEHTYHVSSPITIFSLGNALNNLTDMVNTLSWNIIPEDSSETDISLKTTLLFKIKKLFQEELAQDLKNHQKEFEALFEKYLGEKQDKDNDVSTQLERIIARLDSTAQFDAIITKIDALNQSLNGEKPQEVDLDPVLKKLEEVRLQLDKVNLSEDSKKEFEEIKKALNNIKVVLSKPDEPDQGIRGIVQDMSEGIIMNFKERIADLAFIKGKLK